MSPPGIYVESFLRADVDAVWSHTQTPEVHQRWDLRFTTIQYLPRPSLDEPQRFLYETKLLPGIAIRGTGESVGQRIGPDGQASSALKFGSPQRWCLIRTGSGYWKYIPTPNGTRFLTWYDYEVRFGVFGMLVDRLTLRPAMGWATAWSFDRLRLWIEQGQSPRALHPPHRRLHHRPPRRRFRLALARPHSQAPRPRSHRTHHAPPGPASHQPPLYGLEPPKSSGAS